MDEEHGLLPYMVAAASYTCVSAPVSAVCGFPKRIRTVLQGLSLLAALLPAPQLRPALLQGLATGLGGLDAQLASAAAAALVNVLAVQPGSADAAGDGTSTGGDGSQAAGGSAPAAEAGGDELLRAVLDDLPALWQQCDRYRDMFTVGSHFLLGLLKLIPLLITLNEHASRVWHL